MKRLVALLAALLLVAPGAAVPADLANCARTSTGMVPLTDLDAKTYGGFRGGLYPGGRNVPSRKYLKQGLDAAHRVTPVDGRVVLLSIGMSNTTQEFSAFKQLADADPAKSARVTLVDGAQGGQDAERVKDPAGPFWSGVETRLRQAGATAGQVQAVWLKEAIAGGNEGFPADARRLRADLRAIVGILGSRFANLRLIYVSSRTYAGYASTSLNPEPAAYDSGFAVKWLVGDRIDGHLAGPWIGWGPYLWTDGERGRRDGFTWGCADTRDDGTHPSPSGVEKVAQLLLSFFKTTPTARGWFTAP